MGELQIAIYRMAWKYEYSARELITALSESYGENSVYWEEMVAGEIKKWGPLPLLPGEDGFVGESDD